MFFRRLLLLFVLSIPMAMYSQTTDLLISEYVEGSNNNKYIEIYNGTGGNVNLANYAIRIYSNGAGTPTATINLTTTIATGTVYVLANSAATIWPGTPDQTSGSVNFNGDDAVELYNTSTASMVDLVGNIGCDPGSEWNSGGNSTENNTIVRNAGICSGVTSDPNNGGCPFPTLAGEWLQSAIDDISNLGSHTNTCGAPCTPNAEPTANSSSLTISNIDCYNMDLSWTSGNGANRIVVAATSPISGTPTDQILYTANSNFGGGSTIAAGEFVVYNGSGNSVSVSGLTTNTTYYFAIFEYNGSVANCEENYLTTGMATNNDITTLCSCPELTGILVDACGGTVEGINEFFTFENGNNSLYLDSLSATFPSGGTFCNSGCGGSTWTTNPTYVAQLNTTAVCPGLFVEADPIPANARAIVFTGSSPTYNFDFSGLCSTGPYYAVFANNTVTSGRFANYDATCSNRTLNVDFGTGCTDAVTYDRCLLSNVDGDYVTFNAAGTPTYQNDGCTPSAILPIELLYFRGEHSNLQNKLYWETALEINNDFFTVEKSEDAIDFSPIGIVMGAGNSYSKLQYAFNDDYLTQSTNYYRLKQTDFDGKYSYSNIIVLKSGIGSTIYFNNNLNTLELGHQGLKDVRIYNLSGQLMFTGLQLTGSIPINLAKGMYVVSVGSSTESSNIKIVIH